MDTQDPPSDPAISLLGGLRALDNEKDAMTSGCLDRKEVRGTICGVHSTGTGRLEFYIQDVFFWYLAGRSAPTGLAIVHWIGYQLIKI